MSTTPNPETPTPRTDAAVLPVAASSADWIDGAEVAVKFARTLERELAATTKERDALRQCTADTSALDNKTLALTALRKELASAETALHALGYEKYGFGWGITIAEPSPVADTKAGQLMEALRPFIDFVNVHDGDTLSQIDQDSIKMLTATGSWSKPAYITLGDIRKLAQPFALAEITHGNEILRKFCGEPAKAGQDFETWLAEATKWGNSLYSDHETMLIRGSSIHALRTGWNATLASQATALEAIRKENEELKASLKIYKRQLTEDLQFGSLFQPGGRFNKEANLILGRSAVAEGGKWLVAQYDRQQSDLSSLQSQLQEAREKECNLLNQHAELEDVLLEESKQQRATIASQSAEIESIGKAENEAHEMWLDALGQNNLVESYNTGETAEETIGAIVARLTDKFDSLRAELTRLKTGIEQAAARLEQSAHPFDDACAILRNLAVKEGKK